MATLITGSKRPRDLHWFHAGPLLFGDWGTSRLYVLGLAFYYTGHASPLYLTAMSLIMIAVAWAYSVICRCFPEGGGVYAAARQLSPTLSVIGATLLLCDYIVTAALSVVEGYHYFNAPHGWVVGLSVVTIFAIGIINWLGSKSAGRFALGIAVAAIVLSLLIALMCIPMVLEGIKTVSTGHTSISDPWTRWENLVRVILALSGLEAVANMTGLMKEPVAKTSRRTIFPVLIEVVCLNMIFGLAINALPDLKPVEMPHYVQYERGNNREGEGGQPKFFNSSEIPEHVREYRDTAMRQLADVSTTRLTGSARAGQIMAIVSGIIFGLLLISAVNTAVMAMVSVKYAMANDGELPQAFKKLNYSGVPWIGLIFASILPAGLLMINADAKWLSELYAIGVVGAIAINVLCCAVNGKLAITVWERRGMWVLGAFMSLVFVTIVIAKPNAFMFAGIMVGSVLIARFAVHVHKSRRKEELPGAVSWLAEVQREPLKLDPGKPRIMLAARGRDQAEFAVDLAGQRNATLFVIFIRTLRLLNVSEGATPRIEDDPDAQEALGTVTMLARQRGVACVPIYVSSPNIAEEILDYTVTFGCDTLIIGRSKRSGLSRSVEGDVVSEIKKHLPSLVNLIERDRTGPLHADGTMLPDAPTSGDVGQGEKK